jgi:uncharacterized delta-60 repeat protein
MTRRFRRRCRPNLFALEGREVPAVVGGLDPSFGTGGKVTTDFGATDTATGVAVQTDGKIVVAGSFDAGSSDFAVARYNPDGTLDTTFGGGDGKATITFGGKDFATAVALQADGKIVVVGFTDVGGGAGNPNNFAVARLNPDGSLDTTFSGDGKATVDFGADDRATAVAIRPDGRIVVGGFDDGGSSDFAIAQFKTDGTLDTTFSADGKFTFTFGGKDFATALALQPDGKIVMAGYTDQGGGTVNNFAVARVLADGSGLDTTFDTDGKQTVDFGGDDKANGVALQADGKIVAVGQGNGVGFRDVAVARLNADGTLDTKATFQLGGFDIGKAVAIQPDGKIVIASLVNDGSAETAPNDFSVLRLNTDLSRDTTFNAAGTGSSGAGEARFDLGGDDQANAVALQPNGQILVAGATAGNFAVLRVNGTVGATINNQALATGTADGKGVLYTVAPGATKFTDPGTAIDLLPGTTAKNVRAAVADVNGDGVLDRIVVSGPGAPVTVSVRSGVDNSVLVAPFGVFEASFTGGGFVAAADLDGDGKAEVIVTPDEGGGPVVAVYSGSKLATGSTGDAAQIVRFFGIADTAFRGGARPAVGDVNGDGTRDLVVSAGFLGGPRVAVFTGKDIVAAKTDPGRLVTDFFAFENTVRNGVFVAVGDVDGDGFDDLVFGGGPTAGPRVRVVSGKVLLGVTSLTDLDTAVPATPGLQIGNFFAGDPATRGGVPVAVKDVDGDNKADVVTASGENLSGFPALLSRVLVFLDQTVLGGSSTPAADQSLDPFASATLPGGVFVG